MNNELKATVKLTEEGIEETLDILGEVTRNFYELRTRLFEEAFRDWLIAKGWTPPSGDVK